MKPKKVLEISKRVGIKGMRDLGLFILQKRRFDRLYHPPVYAQIEITKGCNLRCRVCGISHYKVKGGHMSLADFEVILTKLDGLQEIMLHGLGEPFMNPDFVAMVRAAKTRGIRVSTTTNGTLLTEEIGRALIEAELDLMSVSIDGSTAETFEMNRIGTKFEPVLKNLYRMGELKRELGAEKLQLNIGCILTNHNYHQMPDMVRMAHEVGATKLNVWRLQGGDVFSDIDDLKLEVIDQDKVEPYFAESRRLAAEYGLELELPPYERIYNAPICEWPWRGMYITWDGYVTPCCIICYDEIKNFGNLLEEDASAIWNGPDYQAFRADLRSDDPSDLCKDCPYSLPWMAKLKPLPKKADLLMIKQAPTSTNGSPTHNSDVKLPTQVWIE